MPEHASTPILAVQNLTCSKPGHHIFHEASFTINKGDVVVLRGRSGSGKTTLLKCLSHLNLYSGDILYHGKKPVDCGIPQYRTRVLYVPQRPAALASTPRAFLSLVAGFKSRASAHGGGSAAARAMAAQTASDGPIALAQAWGVEEELWDRDWSGLSGGESQRIALAIAVGLGTAEVLLLDEPTSALDHETSAIVEDHILKRVDAPEASINAVVWITHSDDQARRVGNRFFTIRDGRISEREEANGEP